MLYERFGDLKFKYRNREFWCRGYYVDTVGKNKEKIRDYIKKQLEEDKLGTQLCLPYPGSPFTGAHNKVGNDNISDDREGEEELLPGSERSQ